MAFPNAFTAAVDGVTTVAAALVNQLEAKVGVNNSTDPNSLDYKVTHLLSALTGIIVPFGGASAPTGFLLCDGSAVSRTTYATLFGVIGTTYGVGNGSTTFNLPDLRQRFPLGKAVSGDGSTLGGVGGILSGAHTHILMENSLSEDKLKDSVGGFVTLGAGDTNTHILKSTDAQGATPPYQVVNYIIKY